MNRNLTVLVCLLTLSLFFQGGGSTAHERTADPTPWPADLPVYDHIVIVIEENKDYCQIVDNPAAPFINKTLRSEGANFTQIFGEEHHSQGNYFWLFSGSNQGVGFRDGVPDVPIDAPNLGSSLISKGRSFKGYSEDLPAIGSRVLFAPTDAKVALYARKHVPWVSFVNVPNGPFPQQSSNLRFEDFPKDEAKFNSLPTVSIVVPNLMNDMHNGDPKESIPRGDMHNGDPKESIPRGDKWLQDNLGSYCRWAKTHNSLLILTFDENDDKTNEIGLTDPFAKTDTQAGKDRQNRICTLFIGAHVIPGDYPEGKGITHVNILRTIEAMYGLPRAGAQQQYAAQGGIKDDYIVTDVFRKVK